MSLKPGKYEQNEVVDRLGHLQHVGPITIKGIFLAISGYIVCVAHAAHSVIFLFGSPGSRFIYISQRIA
jgi:hypothetical protein